MISWLPPFSTVTGSVVSLVYPFAVVRVSTTLYTISLPPSCVGRLLHVLLQPVVVSTSTLPTSVVAPSTVFFSVMVASTPLRLPSWSFASSQVLVTVISVTSGI